MLFDPIFTGDFNAVDSPFFGYMGQDFFETYSGGTAS